MTTLDSQTDNSLCHLDKLPHVEWDNLTPGSSGCTFPDGLSPLECQMAGHPFDGKKHTIGMLRRRNGHILKPATKAILGEREIAFYENLQTSQDPTIAQLKNFVPCYYGTTELKVFNKRTKFLTLKDITEGMAEPCVMDIKIGHRTWDPLATPEKRATEELKYAESKRAYGFCITGFQVYCLSTGRLKKFDRDYGKKLDAKGVVEALETFLNITPERPACRQLILQLLSFLWQIRLLFRTQRKFRFYSSSLLVAYDARRLRQHCVIDKDSDGTSMKRETKSTSFASSGRTVSGAGATEETAPFSTVSTAKTAKRNQIDAPMNPVLERGVSVCNSGFTESIEDDKISNWSGSCSLNQKADCWLHPSYSTQSYAKNNDDTKNATLENDERIISITNEPHDSERDWVRLNMIDFTHVFPAADDGSLDLNYLEGIENLFKLMETFLGDCKDSSEQNCHISTMI